MCVCGVCPWVCGCICLYMYMQRPEDLACLHLLLFPALFLRDGVSHWRLLSQLCRLVGKLLGFAYPCPTYTLISYPLSLLSAPWCVQFWWLPKSHFKGLPRDLSERIQWARAHWVRADKVSVRLARRGKSGDLGRKGGLSHHPKTEDSCMISICCETVSTDAVFYTGAGIVKERGPGLGPSYLCFQWRCPTLLHPCDLEFL